MTVELADYGLEDLVPGTEVRTGSGRRLIVRAPIGGGNEGLVLHANCAGEDVALKILRPDRSGTRLPRTRELVRRAIASRVDARIAAPQDIVEYAGRVGHVSRLAQGADVAALGENPAALNLRQRVMAVLKLGALLAKLHAVDIAFGDLNKGAVKVRPMGDADADVQLVDLDSAVMKGVPLPPTLGAPDTAAPELRTGVQPSTVAAWKAADWTAFGHISVDLLFNKTASCGIEDEQQQIDAFMGVPPFLQDNAHGRQVDRRAGLPSDMVPQQLRRLLRRLFDPNPAVRDGRAVLRVLVNEVVNNHQIQCGSCGLAIFAHEGSRTCPVCANPLAAAAQLVLPNGQRLPVTGDLPVTRELLGGLPFVSRMHARLFLLGSVPFVVSLSTGSWTTLVRGAAKMQLAPGVHVPLLPGDRLRFGSARYAEVMLIAA